MILGGCDSLPQAVLAPTLATGSQSPATDAALSRGVKGIDSSDVPEKSVRRPTGSHRARESNIEVEA
jgi:hypothetical protein